MTSLESPREMLHVIDRTTVYNDVLSLYRKELEKVTLEYTFWVHFKGEIAIDVGVTTHMFSAFFAEPYLRL